MPAKGRKTVKPKATKSNVAKPMSKAGSLRKKVTFNWKIVAIIGVILVVALGYLFVRLSEAGNSKVRGATAWRYEGSNLAGKLVDKSDGSQAIESIVKDGAERISVTGAFYGLSYSKSSYCFQYATSGPVTISSWAYVNDTTKLGFYERLDEPTNGKATKCFDLEAKDAGDYKDIFFIIDAAAGQKAYFYYMREEPISTPSAPAPAPGTKQQPTQAPAPQQNCATMINGRGNQGPCVTLIQQRLKDLGYDPGSVDGIYGSKTTAAVKVFQSRSGLTQDGVVGSQTWVALTSPNAARKQ